MWIGAVLAVESTEYITKKQENRRNEAYLDDKMGRDS